MGKKKAAAVVISAETKQLIADIQGKPPAAANTPAAPVTGGKGKKVCPGCQKLLGARTMVCACGHIFTPKTASPGSSKPRGVEPDFEKMAMTFVLFDNAGNIDKAMKAVENYSEDSLAEFIANCGGVNSAKAVLESLAAKAGK